MHQYAYRKLKGRIIELYGSQAAFAKDIGLSCNSISKKLNRKTEFSQSDVEKWAGILKISRQDYGEYFYT